MRWTSAAATFENATSATAPGTVTASRTCTPFRMVSQYRSHSPLAAAWLRGEKADCASAIPATPTTTDWKLRAYALTVTAPASIPDAIVST